MHEWTPQSDGRIAVRRQLREDTHLMVVAELADAIATAGQRKAKYFGRPFDVQTDTCHSISGQCRSSAAENEQMILARNARTPHHPPPTQ
jgi:hypothetical protein